MKLFDSIQIRRPKMSKFDLSHERKFSMNHGDLVPILVQDVLPGDKFRVNTEILARLQPLQSPMMHRVKIFTHFFFVPNRLVMDQWDDFITGGKDGTDATVAPYFDIDTTNAADGKFAGGKLADYMGLPNVAAGAVTDVTKVSALPFRAYQLIYDEYYRDQNLTPEVAASKSSGVQVGAEVTKICTMRKRSWEHDYFTSALPWAQRGPSVLMPFSATVTYLSTSLVKTSAGANAGTNQNLGVMPAAAGQLDVDSSGAGTAGRIENISNITSGTSSINDLRRAERLQEWLEKNARAGARYIEQILAHFGVRSSDARLQRPEYLGGASNPIVISDIPSTFESAGTDPQGTMSGSGIGVSDIHGFKRKFEEHGYVIGIMSILPKTAYQQGIERHFTKFDKLDYAWPEFSQIGEQDIKQKEIYYAPASALGTCEGTFGYIPRYAEYKFKPSSVHGDFRTSLSYWHMGRIFASAPALNTSFVEADPTYRVFAVTDPAVHHYLVQMYHNISAIRPLPYYGTPTL